MTHRSRWLAGLAAIALAFITAATAFGYAGEVAAEVTVAGPGGTLKCGVNIPLTATVLDADGKPIAGQPVAWSWVSRVSASDVIKSSPTTTNASGVASTNVFLACVPGSRRIRATADAVSGSAVLNVTAAGLPNTSTLPGETPAPQGLPIIGTLLAVLAIAAGGGLTLRRIARSRG